MAIITTSIFGNKRRTEYVRIFCDNAIVPTYAHDADAGCDIYAKLNTDSIVVPSLTSKITFKSLIKSLFGFKQKEPQKTVTKIHTGIYVDIPYGYEIQIRSRSGLFGYGIIADGTIDSGYTGEIIVQLWNVSQYDYVIENRTRIAQMIFNPVAKAKFVEVDTLEELQNVNSVRGANGFGHTGLK